MKKIAASFVIILILCSCVGVCANRPSDTNATKETIRLYRNLKKLQQRGFMIGQQDALAYGVKWKYEDGRCDMKEVAGDYPAVYGWELGHLEIGASENLDGVPFDKMVGYIKEAYQRGGVITISWHGDNPMTGKSAWDPEKGTVEAILPGGAKNVEFNAQLDKIADFMCQLKGAKGESIPVIFRPFHEHTGHWFWWGNRTTCNDAYVKLFRYTVEYLKSKDVHHLLYAYNTGVEFNNESEFLARYPGDDVVDLLTFDAYQRGNAEKNTSFAEDLDKHLSIIEKLASEKGKVAAIGETGYSQIPYSEWWTKRLLPVLLKHNFSYVLFWRNAGYKEKEKEEEYYVPYTGHASEASFIEFFSNQKVISQSDVSYREMYK